MDRNDIKSCNQDELQTLFQQWDEPRYRLNQLFNWIYRRKAIDWNEMSNLPRPLRERLARHYSLNSLRLVRKQGSRDTTEKFLWHLADGALIESVLIPANPALYGVSSDRHTLCVSTQVGCAYGCKFCASGLEGWKRNLLPYEIVEQVLAVERFQEIEMSQTPDARPQVTSRADAELPPGGQFTEAGTGASLRGRESARVDRLINNLVIMGMGEPLANYENLIRALSILNAPWGAGIGARKITISTSGLVPQIRRLADEPLQFRLAISLHGATDEVRSKIMPINRKYPLQQLAAACDYYITRKGKMITLEYILIGGVNDNLAQVKPLAELASRLHAKVNLIPYNRVDELAWNRPPEVDQVAFLEALEKQNVPATLRREKGHDIDAACGQLRLKTERELHRA